MLNTTTPFLEVVREPCPGSDRTFSGLLLALGHLAFSRTWSGCSHAGSTYRQPEPMIPWPGYDCGTCGEVMP